MFEFADREPICDSGHTLDVDVIDAPISKRVSILSKVNVSVDESVESELDLRGQRFEEAMSNLEAYLDRAFRSGRSFVNIIHGIGTGALREGTLKLLSQLPYVHEFRDGGPGGGGAGATVVEFER